jgi:hypothetical protein
LTVTSVDPGRNEAVAKPGAIQYFYDNFNKPFFRIRISNTGSRLFFKWVFINVFLILEVLKCMQDTVFCEMAVEQL